MTASFFCACFAALALFFLPRSAAIAFFFCAFSAAAPPASAADRAPTGTLMESIRPTGPLEAIFLSLSFDPDETSIGLSPSPRTQGPEIADALAQFSDPTAAWSAIEKKKRDAGFSGGRVFAQFSFRDDGQADFTCGISKADKGSIEDTREQGIWFSNIGQGSFVNFKRASREERVRAIALCLRNLPGMPPLKELPRQLRGVIIGTEAYRWGEEWFKSKGLIGTERQYDEALRCLVSQEARKIPDATGDTAVFKVTRSEAYTHSVVHVDKNIPINQWTTVETDEIKSTSVALAVTTLKNAQAIAAASSIDASWGLWPSRLGLESVDPGPFNSVFKEALGDVSLCLAQAGVIDPRAFAHLVEPQNPTHCP